MPLFHDRNGRFSPERTLALVAVVLPALWLAGLALAPGTGGEGVLLPGAGPAGAPPGLGAGEAMLPPGPGAGGAFAGGPAAGAVGALGARPLSAAIHFAGLWALRFLWLSLAVSPLRRLYAWPKLHFARRILGVAALAYALLHVGLFVADQGAARALGEVVRRIYLVIGAVAVIGLVALGATSFNAAVRWLGAVRWNRLHRLAYPIAVLAGLHFFMQSRLDVSQPAVMAGLLVLLFAERLRHRMQGTVTPAGFALLALSSALATVVIEVAWYGLATRVDPWRVLEANLTFVLGPSPAWWVLGIGLVVAAGAAVRLRAQPAAPAGRPRASRAASRPADGGKR